MFGHKVFSSDFSEILCSSSYIMLLYLRIGHEMIKVYLFSHVQ